MGVADAAYIRASPVLKDMLYLPTQVPENGDNPRVSHLGSCFGLEANRGVGRVLSWRLRILCSRIEVWLSARSLN